jgi:hypothetical protein
MKPPSLPLVFQCWADGTLSTCLSGSGFTQFVDLVAGIAGREPVSGKNPGLILDRDGVAIATSGYYYQISKFGYHHIVNPAAMAVIKAGSRTVGSVSVMTTSCALAYGLAYGLATAAMTCDPAGAAFNLRGQTARLIAFRRNHLSHEINIRYTLSQRRGVGLLCNLSWIWVSYWCICVANYVSCAT